MTTCHSPKIRTKWSNATKAKISPATSENVFASMSDPPSFVEDSTQRSLRTCSERNGHQNGREPVKNGTQRHVRSIFAIQINTCQDRTKRVGTTVTKFSVRCLQPLSAPSMAPKRSIRFDRVRASPCAAPNVGMVVGSERRNADHIMISTGLGGRSLRHELSI